MEMRKVIITILVMALAASAAWVVFREKRTARGPWGEIPIEEAIAIIKAHVAKIEKIPEENIRIDKIELRPPTESEATFLRESREGKDPPEFMWDASVTRFPWGGFTSENQKLGGYVGMVWLDAYTGEIVVASFLD